MLPPPLLQSELLFDGFHGSSRNVLLVHGNDRFLSFQKHMEMGAFGRGERRALPCQPPLELGALHESIIGSSVYFL